MKQYRIEITELAEQDLENAGDYIAYELKNPTAAEDSLRIVCRGYFHRNLRKNELIC